MKNTLFLVVFFHLFLTGCTTNYYVDENDYPTSKNYEKISVYVTNPDHDAYRILKKSKIYNLSNNPNEANKLTLNHLWGRSGKCGMGYLAPIYTLGIIPYGEYDTKYLMYSLESQGSTKIYSHKLHYRDRLSAWEFPLKPFAYSLNGAQARALALSQREACQTFANCIQDKYLRSVFEEGMIKRPAPSIIPPAP